MRNIYPKERTLISKDRIIIQVSTRIKENGLEENLPILQELVNRSRMLIYVTSVDSDKMYFNILVQNTIISIGYFTQSDKYYITKIEENQKKSYVKFLKNAILVYFPNITIEAGITLQPENTQKILVQKVEKVSLAQLPQAMINVAKQQNQEIQLKEKEDDMIGKRLEKLLTLSSTYNKYEKEKGKQQNNKMPLNYTKIETQAEYENTYLFYVGNTQEYQELDYVKITDVNSNDEFKINGQILKIEQIKQYQNKVSIQLSEQIDFKQIPTEGIIHPVYQDVQNRVRERVIENIKKGNIPAKYLYKTLENFTYLPFKQIDFSKLEESMQKEQYPLNPSQLKAVEKGIASEDLSLILGPPGTGKTTVIAWWVKYFLKQKKRVLISSQNNSAVDNVLERIGKEYKSVIRLRR